MDINKERDKGTQKAGVPVTAGRGWAIDGPHTDRVNKGVCSGDQGSTGNIQLQFVRADALLQKFTAFTGYLPHYKWQAVWSEK